MGDKRREELAALPAEELEKRLREAFFYTDKIDETVFQELEALREALEAKQPRAYDRTPEESWAQFQEDHARELAEFCDRERRAKAARRTGRVRAALRGALLAAVVLVLLAGAALAADSLGLVAWVPRWNAAAGRYEPVAADAWERPIPMALAELGITEPVYPAYLPEGFVITESRISEEPLVLIEHFSRGNERLSITVTPIKGFEAAVYQNDGELVQEYESGKGIHYVFERENTVTAIWYTKHYATSISGNTTRAEIRKIMDSLLEGFTKGQG